MKKFVLILIGVLVVLTVGGVVLLGTMDIPAPTHTNEIVLPNDRFPR